MKIILSIKGFIMKQVENTLYAQIGGSETIDRLVSSFYDKVAKHPALIPIFPNELTETARKQKQFLTQFLGGPPIYSEEHGHPMLRARHLPFPISPSRASAWLQCMKEAVDETNIESPAKEQLLSRLTFTAHHMVNTTDDNPSEGKENDN
jgi:hemoglobin